MQIVITNGNDERFIMLCKQLDDYLNEIVGGEKQRQEYVQLNSLQEIHDVVLLIEEQAAVGCGSFKHYDDDTVELKRIFIRDDFRGRNLGQLMITELENIARKEGYRKAILETGKPLTRAFHLYQGLGYHVIDNYGPYVHLTDSICMQKYL